MGLNGNVRNAQLVVMDDGNVGEPPPQEQFGYETTSISRNTDQKMF